MSEVGEKWALGGWGGKWGEQEEEEEVALLGVYAVSEEE
jgi:hypothetical protein